MRVRPARKGDFETIVETGLAGFIELKNALKSYKEYFEIIRGIGGEVLVVEEEGDILGEAEIIPQSDLSVAGPHVFLKNLASLKEDRAVKRELLRACKSMAKSWGFSFLDHVPINEEIEELEVLGFKTTMANQMMLKTEPKRLFSLAKVKEGVSERYPTDLALISGKVRPGRLAWAVLLQESGKPKNKAYTIKVGRFKFISIISFLNQTSHLTFYGAPASGPGEIFDALCATLTIAKDLEIEELRTLSWARYLCPFESAGFEVEKQVPLMRLRVD